MVTRAWMLFYVFLVAGVALTLPSASRNYSGDIWTFVGLACFAFALLFGSLEAAADLRKKRSHSSQSNERHPQ